MFAPATTADLKPGEKVFVPGAKKMPDGTAVAGVVVFGRDGLTPPM